MKKMDLSGLIQAAMQKAMDYINEENEKWNNAEEFTTNYKFHCEV